VETVRELNLQTRKGSKIINEVVAHEKPIPVLLAMKEILDKGRSSVRLRSLSARYNCIGMVVASRRAYVEPVYLLQILADDGFRKLNDAVQAREGDVVVYEDPESDEPSHVGIILWRNVPLRETDDVWWVLSKWGLDGPEYIHLASDVPKVYGSPTQYWTDRRLP
jgi:hypothetical protein